MTKLLGTKLSLIFALLTTINAYALQVSANQKERAELQKGPSQEQNLRILRLHKREANRGLPKADPFRIPVDRPVSETDRAQYLIMSTTGDFSSLEAKLQMARDLPADMELVLFAQRAGPATDAALLPFQQILPVHRLHLIVLPNANNGFWARDGLPIPLWNEQGHLALVGARYYHDFEPDSAVANFFPSELAQHNYFFEGGNFAPSPTGACVIVNNSRVQRMPDEIFTTHYGCRSLLRLPHERGIGHADETFKFIDERRVLSDSSTHKSLLENAGFEVTLVPRPRNDIETHVNALFVNGTAFVPVFNQPTDSVALQIYRDMGFNAVGINSTTLSNRGRGSLHCITMTYPPTPFQQLRALLTQAH